MLASGSLGSLMVLGHESHNDIRYGRSGRSGNPKIADSSLEPAGSKPGQVKPKTLKLILVAS